VKRQHAADEVRSSKRALREEMRALRCAVTDETAARAGLAAAHLLAAHLEREPPPPDGVALLYAPLPGELNTLSIDAMLRGRGVAVAYPRVSDDGRLALHRCSPLELQPGRFGIAEPHPSTAPVDAMAVVLVLVPGLAFDRAGRRLGFGGGYYDRLLESIPDAVRFGACLPEQVVARVPAAPHDAAVDFLLCGDAGGGDAGGLFLTHARTHGSRRRAEEPR
jgi:5-formyltetrahydrofolate cyclo-ligase